jgi:signal transduction histidine kinase
MQHTQRGNSAGDYASGIRTIAYLVTGTVLILTFIFFIKTYADEKHKVIKSMHIEAARIEKRLQENLKYTSHVMYMVAEQIKQHPDDLEYINKVLSKYRTNPNITNVLSWTYFFWIDHHQKMRVNTIEGILSEPKDEILNSHLYFSSLTPRKLFFGITHYGRLSKRKVLPLAWGETDAEGNHIGSVMVSFDINNIAERLRDALRDEFTNFAFIDHRLRAIIKSKPVISKVGIRDNVIVSHNLISLIKKMNFYSLEPKEFSYIDMFSGLNYYIKKIDEYPFILLINIDHKEISNNILNTVFYKFIEITIFASFFLILIISVYKRETWLRSKAEKATDVAIKATNAKTDFLAYTAHELRSPLGFILTGSEIMQKELFGAIPGRYKEYIDGIHHSANLIVEFIDDILDEAHIAEGNFKIEEQSERIEEIISKAIDINETRFNNRQISIYSDIKPNIPNVICDRRRILQALNNLISNAIKYSNDYTTVTVSAELVNDKLQVTVSDEGYGMNEEDIRVAFTRFGTVSKKNVNSIQSYGLGLPIVKKLIDAHGASLSVKSEKNVGTAITITFPANKLDESSLPDNTDSGKFNSSDNNSSETEGQEESKTNKKN